MEAKILQKVEDKIQNDKSWASVVSRYRYGSKRTASKLQTIHSDYNSKWYDFH